MRQGTPCQLHASGLAHAGFGWGCSHVRSPGQPTCIAVVGQAGRQAGASCSLISMWIPCSTPTRTQYSRTLDVLCGGPAVMLFISQEAYPNMGNLTVPSRTSSGSVAQAAQKQGRSASFYGHSKLPKLCQDLPPLRPSQSHRFSSSTALPVSLLEAPVNVKLVAQSCCRWRMLERLRNA